MKNKFPAAILPVVIAVLLSQVFLSLALLRFDRTYGFIGFAVSAFTALMIIILTAAFSRNSIKRISRMNAHLETSAAEYMNSLPAPIAVLDQEGKIVWYNCTFLDRISSGNDVYGLDFQELFKLDISSIQKNDISECQVNGSNYRIMLEKFSENDISFLIIYFHDISEYHVLRRLYSETRPNVVIITIDTYEEIMQNAKETEKARVSVEMEQLMERFMGSTNGFAKKISPNTFYAVIENRHLEEKINNRFKVLDLAREIKIAGKYPLTLSIGVGAGAESLEDSEKIARQCLDMALGRGGDQAVVKTENGYRFFGGVSKGVEKMSQTKTRIIANAMQDVIMNASSVYIMGHRFGDLDSVGSACGLAGALRLLGKDVHIVVDRQKNLAVNLIDAVEKQAGEDLFIPPSAAISSISDNDLLIIVDIHNKDFIESPELYQKCRQGVVIDHHRKTVNFIDNAVIFHHEPYASSASEMVTEIIRYFNFKSDEKLPTIYADALLAGIMLDTKNFVMRTGVHTFEAAAFLKKLGADTVAVKLLFSSSFDSYKRKSQIVAAAKIHGSCAIAAADFKSDDIRVVAPQAADELLYITDVDASFVLYKTGSTVNISARSLGAVNVQVIMEKLGGGGHQTMAAVQLENKTIQESVKALIKAIDAREKETEQDNI